MVINHNDTFVNDSRCMAHADGYNRIDFRTTSLVKGSDATSAMVAIRFPIIAPARYSSR